MGVWIEIFPVLSVPFAPEVTPCVGVWIEINTPSTADTRIQKVTPCVGVWIEIEQSTCRSGQKIVTPCVGVWIEIIISRTPFISSLSHSLRGSVD